MLCIRAPRRRTASFWESKSTRTTVSSLYWGSASSLERMGAWALQVGHQLAWIHTSTGLPDLIAVSKAEGV